jgi:hypothetical protein
MNRDRLLAKLREHAPGPQALESALVGYRIIQTAERRLMRPTTRTPIFQSARTKRAGISLAQNTGDRCDPCCDAGGGRHTASLTPTSRLRAGSAATLHKRRPRPQPGLAPANPRVARPTWSPLAQTSGWSVILSQLPANALRICRIHNSFTRRGIPVAPTG